MDINNNILAFELLLNDSNPENILLGIAKRVKRRRLELNFTQNIFAKRAGMTLSSYRRFETIGEISLKSLIKIAIALDSVDEFQNLFTKKHFQNLDEIISVKKAKTKKRGRKNE